MEKTVSPESAVIGALEQAFWVMDHQIAEERHRHHVTGGCTACVALFILGKVFVSNAGDSRGIMGLDAVPLPMSFDFTPETETQRIRKLGARHPELLGGEFTHLEFLRRPLRSDVGKKAAYRDHYMKGWSLKTITEADLKYPLVCGEGKRVSALRGCLVWLLLEWSCFGLVCGGKGNRIVLDNELLLKIFSLIFSYI
ncbi:UNVERIFIED_CONTAM: hypothetical protein GTU68_051962 [Idotea baltica]|nr:hypothetical protein [Idotea baltica]